MEFIVVTTLTIVIVLVYVKKQIKHHLVLSSIMTHGAYDRLVSFGGEKSNQKKVKIILNGTRAIIFIKIDGSINLAENRYS